MERRWSREHDRCRGCGETSRRHHGRGYCRACHQARWQQTAGAKATRRRWWRRRYYGDETFRRRSIATAAEGVRRARARRKARQGPGPTTGRGDA